MNDASAQAQETPSDARELFDPARPPFGGVPGAVRFSDAEAAILAVAADRIIPGGDGFPAPSAVGIVDFFARYLTPSGQKPLHFPFAAEDAFKAAVRGLGERFLSADADGQVGILERLELEDETFFLQLRDLVYYGYYSRPEVTAAINENLEAGRDYRGTPQPYGYAGTIEEWDESLLTRVRGDYIRTEDVKPLTVRAPEAAQDPTPLVEA